MRIRSLACVFAMLVLLFDSAPGGAQQSCAAAARTVIQGDLPFFGGEAAGLGYDPANNDLYIAENPFSFQNLGSPQVLKIHLADNSQTILAPPGGFGDVTAVVFYGGNLYVADGNGYANSFFTQPTPLNVIWQFAPATGAWTQVVTGVNNPTGLAFDSSGNMYVSSWADMIVYEYTYSAGAFSSTPLTRWIAPDPTSSPYGLAVDQADNLYIAGFGQSFNTGTKIFKVDTAGNTSVFFDPGIQEPHSLAFDSSGNLYVSYYDSSQIIRIAPDGTFALFPGGWTASDAPNGLAITPAGDVFTAVNGSSTVDGMAAIIMFHPVLASVNAAAEFSASSNPNNAWSYGYTTSGGFTLLPSSLNAPATDFLTDATASPGLDFWTQSSSLPAPLSLLVPDVVHNGQSTVLTPDCCSPILPGVLALQPGPAGTNASVRWTAPIAGTYQVLGAFSYLDYTTPQTADSVNVSGVYTSSSTNTATPFLASTSITSGAPTPFGGSFNMAACDTVDLTVGAALLTGATGLDAVILPSVSSSNLPLTIGTAWFGTQPAGVANVTTVNVANNGTDALALGQFTIIGANAADFQIVSGQDACSNTTLAGQSGCQLAVSFQGSAVGARSAALEVMATDTTAGQAGLFTSPAAGVGTANMIATLTSDASTVVFGQTVNFTAAVTGIGGLGNPVSGTVQFMADNVLLNSVPVDSTGQAKFAISSLGVGSHWITGRFVPESGTAFLGLSQSALQETVVPPISPAFTTSNSITFLVGTPNSFTITATGSPVPGIAMSGTLPGRLVFTSLGNGSATISGTATGPSQVAQLTFTATNSGGSVQQPFTLTVDESQTISFAPIPDHFVGDAPFNVTATSSSGLAVTLAPSGNCTISGNMVTVTGAGSCTITASQPGNATFAAATPVSQTFNITVPGQCAGNITASALVAAVIPFFGGEAAGIATDPAGNLYVAENPFPFQTAPGGTFPGASPAILMVSADGSTQNLLAPPGGFGEVTAVAFYQGNLYVADGIGYQNSFYAQATAQNAIWQYNPSTSVWTQIITGVNDPTGIAFANNNVYVSSWADQKIYAYSFSGANLGTVWTAPDASAAPYGIAFDAGGDLFIAGFGVSNNTGTKIFEVTAPNVIGYTQSYSVFLDPGILEPVSLVFDPNGNLLITYYDANKILRIAPNGVYGAFPGGGTSAAAPNGIAIDNHNNVFTVINSGSGGQLISIQGLVGCTQTAPVIHWTKPAAIVSGTALSGTQLDANAADASNNPIAGAFTYSPAAGAVLSVGNQILSATFTPADMVTYSTATDSVTLVVKNAATLASVSPSSGAQGTAVNVTLTGAALSGATAVNVSGMGVAPSNVVAVNDSTVTATLTIAPTATIGARSVTVTTSNAGTSNAGGFTVTAPPAPTLTSISPASELRGSSVTVTLTGTNFVAGSSAVITPAATGVSLSAVAVVSSTSITVTIASTGSAAIGSVNVEVTSPGGASNTLPFAITGPVLTAISPISGAPGTSVNVTLTGTGLTGAMSAAVSGTGVTVNNFAQVNDTTVTATLVISSAAGQTARNVTVTSPAGISNAVTFTVVAPSTLKLTSITPNTGVRGTVVPVTLTGTGLTGTTSVRASGTGVTVSGVAVVSDTQVNATFTIAASAALTLRNVTVTTPAGTSNAVTFTVVNPATPVLSSINPASGLRRTAMGSSPIAVTLTGSNFTAGSTVNIASPANGLSVTGTTVVNSTTITATFNTTITAAIGPRSISVTTPGGTSNSVTYTVLGPVLTSITPASALRGQGGAVSVDLFGSGLTGTTAVAVSGGGITVGPVMVSSDTHVTTTFTIAAGAVGTVRNVTVTAPGGVSNAESFTVQIPPTPTISSISPNTGVRGTTVPATVTGTNFIGGETTVAVSGGIAVSGINVTNSSTLTATFTIPTAAAAGAHNVTITVSGAAAASNAMPFTVEPTITSISPNSATHPASGTLAVPVTIIGSNLTGATGLSGLGTGVSVAPGTFAIVNSGTIMATLNISSTATPGIRNIGVKTPIGNTNTEPFTVN